MVAKSDGVHGTGGAAPANAINKQDQTDTEPSSTTVRGGGTASESVFDSRKEQAAPGRADRACEK